MPFIVILVITALALAGSAAFFSVYGLAQVFSGAFWSVVLMGGSLEAGKLVASSFLYRYWDKITLALKAYLMAAILVLMVITSMGISGYLTAAYQADTISLRDDAGKVTSYQAELDRLTKRKDQMDADVAAIGNNYVAAKQRYAKSMQAEYDKINPRIEFLQAEIQKLNTAKLTKEAKVGPIIWFSKVIGKETDDAILWLVLLIVVVFDPLAVALTIATNIAVRERENAKKISLDNIEAPTGQPARPWSEQESADLLKAMEELRNREAAATGLGEIKEVMENISTQVNQLGEADRIRTSIRKDLG